MGIEGVFFQAGDGIRGIRRRLGFRRVLFRSDENTEDAQRRIREKEEHRYKLFLLKVKLEELKLITKEEAEVEKKALKEEYKRKKRAS